MEGEEFRKRILEGERLERITLQQHAEAGALPLLLPTYLSDFPLPGKHPIRVAAVTARRLLTRRVTGPQDLRPEFRSSERAAKTFNLRLGCALIAVLNGPDDILENFWGMDRVRCFRQLAAAGFVAATGPTFSVADESFARPAAHNVHMLMRHHRVVSEIAEAGLTAIPNIYWRSERDLAAWKRWLTANQVDVVSRDFTRTRDRSSTEREFRPFLELLASLGRPVHVVLVGIGPRRAAEFLVRLARRSVTASFVTGDPELCAIKQGQQLIYRGTTPPKSIDGFPRPRASLALENLRVVEKHLLAVATRLAPYETGFRAGCLHNIFKEVPIDVRQTRLRNEPASGSPKG